jgi:hypothetical protein
MSGFLNTLGQKLAERWLTLLVLPGALYLATAITAHILGDTHALDHHYLTRQITVWAKTPTITTVSGQIILLAAVLAGAAAAGLAAQALGRIAEHLALAANWRSWPHPVRQLAQWRVDKRRNHWDTARTKYERLREEAAQALALQGTRLDRTERDTAYRAVTRIAETRPDRPTWSGDRLHTVSLRLREDLGLDLARTWPSLWLTMPDPARTEITNARADLTRATTLAGWALLYAPLTGWWWPAILITAILVATARYRTRAAADTYAQLVEAATRLHAPALVQQSAPPQPGP